MTEQKFKEIKEKIKVAEQLSAESKGKMDSIKEQWQEEYGFNDVESAKKKLEEKKADAEAKRQKRDELMNELENSFDWDSI